MRLDSIIVCLLRQPRTLNLLAFLLDRHYPASREEILSQVSDYKEDWVGGDAKSRESIRRKFERDKAELKALGLGVPVGLLIWREFR